MKIMYIECNMGAAGDMFMSALLELHSDPGGFIKRLNGIGLPGVRVEKDTAVKCGITGTHVSVRVNGSEENERMYEHEHEHHHTGIHEIEHVIGGLSVSEAVRRNALEVYRLIAEAEGYTHGCEIEHIHFHEVGTMDAVADIVGTCMLIEDLAPDKIVASPVHVGSGQVRCAHGVLPVPAPATAHILTGVPVYGGEIRGELCTPTGAALLKYFAAEFGPMPVMSVSKIGCGMGTKDFETANCLRIFMGETQDKTDAVYELCCNLDDMTGEEIGFAAQKLLENGALDVFTSAIGMKKCRPGVMLSCLCRRNQKEKMARLIFRHTSTLGIREYVCGRYILERTEKQAETEYGTVRIKRSAGYGISREKAEYEDLAAIAEKAGITLAEAKRLIQK